MFFGYSELSTFPIRLYSLFRLRNIHGSSRTRKRKCTFHRFQEAGQSRACGEDLIPAVAQDADTGEVLIVGYANELALKTAQKKGWPPSGAPVEMSYGLKGKHPVIF